MDQTLELWKNKLIDLSKRNQLLYFKDLKPSALEVVNPDIGRVYQYLNYGHPFDVFNFDEFVFKKRELAESRGMTITLEEITKKAIDECPLTKFLLVNKNVSTNSALKNINGKAKTSILEQGTNILYVALGFLRWNEPEQPEEHFLAPILLLPIKIEGRGGADPVKISLYEAEAIINPTLKYKLKTSFNFNLSDFDEDEDLLNYFHNLGKRIEPLGWSLDMRVFVSTFSFTKLNMYLDIKDNEALVLANSNIQRLMGNFIGEGNVGDSSTSTEPLTLHNVVDADSSQNDAILMAQRGASMVLEGPPGTGKSQTITNLIANYLANGKKVLFVSEKLAALNVVYNNLKKAGLEDYCLELHSHKIDKKSVLNELYRVLMLPRQTAVKELVESELGKYSESKKLLDDYAYDIQKKVVHLGLSPYEVYCELVRLNEITDIEFSLSPIEEKDQQFFNKAKETLKNYILFLPNIGNDFRNHPWFGIKESPLNYNEKLVFRDKISNLILAFTAIQNNYQNLGPKDLFEDEGLPFVLARVSTLKFVIENPEFDLSNISESEIARLDNLIKEIKPMCSEFISQRNDLSKVINAKGFQLETETLLAKYRFQYANIFRVFKKQYRIDRNLIIECSKIKMNFKTSFSLLNKLSEFNSFSKKLDSKLNEIAPFCPSVICGTETDWVRIEKILFALKQMMKCDLPISSIALASKTMDQHGVLKQCEAVIQICGKLEEDVNFIQSRFEETLFSVINSPLNVVINKMQACRLGFDSLSYFLDFNQTIKALKQLSLYNFICRTIDLKIADQEVIPVFEKTYFAQWVSLIFEQDSILKHFNRVVQDKSVNEFADKDRMLLTLSKVYLKARLSKTRPDPDLISSGSVAGELKREAQKKRKIMPVRFLMKTMGPLVLSLKPCFLMSPLSVSTYLNPKSIKFDVVLFDEASQIFPEDAIGSIYRSEQCIIVGDSKQMPPSNFFNTNIEEEENEDPSNENEVRNDANSFESILKLSEAAFPQKWLRWHYRSRTEDLISFSNRKFYDNKLVTFPSNIKKTIGFGVDYVFCEEGVFDRKTRTNLKEAQLVADLVFESFEKYPEKSVGVVAFSINQQKLIEDRINQKRENQPLFEKFFSESGSEPFFVKNLETVQGDERDIIIFSIAYGYDVENKFYHNFGPLNKEGGERRLNVAITRAKYNVKVVSSVHGFDIDLSRTNSVGVALLKNYLDYAEQTDRDQAYENRTNSDIVPEVASDIAKFLRNQGYEVDTRVGSSEDKIDVAVKSKDREKYLLCIETDNEDYFKYQYTSDRDRLRQEVLQKMGWKYYRVWSTEWVKNPESEKKHLLELIEECEGCTSLGESNLEPPNADKLQDETDPILEENLLQNKSSFQFDIYQFLTHEMIPQQTMTPRDAIFAIVEHEGPINIHYLAARVIDFLSLPRSSVRKMEIEKVAKEIHDSQIVRKKDTFYWTISQKIYHFRAPCPGSPFKNRQIEDIPVEELAQLVYLLVKANISIDKDELFRRINGVVKGNTSNRQINEETEKSLSAAARYLIGLGAIKLERGNAVFLQEISK